jgi:signal transduction histidine kinase/CheY-like chemotaxis protein/HPt (histidine-containing phosphotransfer) domain-containing protein
MEGAGMQEVNAAAVTDDRDEEIKRLKKELRVANREIAQKVSVIATMESNINAKMNVLRALVVENESAKNRAEAASRAKGEFLAKMSHELRTPMNAILGIAQIELQKHDMPEEYASSFEKIYNSGCHLLEIINDILDMSKIETGKMTITPAEYDMPSLISDTAQMSAMRIGSKILAFIVETRPDLPSRMVGDELRIKQILNNLLSNAIKYSERGYVKLTVSHTPREDGDIDLRFDVEDTGQGLKPEDVNRLFTEYSRFNDDINRGVEGTGLGLNITRKFAEMMDGSISVKSEYGIGSTFSVTVRQGRVECEPIGERVSQRLRDFRFSARKSASDMHVDRTLMPYGRVLVVDDIKTNLFVAENFLAPYKLRLDTAISGFEAIAKVKNGETYDIIFMDHMMPLMNGVEATKQIRALGYEGIIIALTANAVVGSAEMFAENGFDDFVSKPIDIKQLNAVLNKYIRDKRAEDAARAAVMPDEPPAPAGRDIPLKLREAFAHDAENAVVTLAAAARDGDYKLYAITAHAMKAALASVGEDALSAAAYGLEKAGEARDAGYIAAHGDIFVEKLTAVMERLRPEPTEDGGGDEVTEDGAFLKEQLTLLIAAAGEYDDQGAYAALARLGEKRWKRETAALLKAINDDISLRSDFETAAEKAEGRLKQL